MPSFHRLLAAAVAVAGSLSSLAVQAGSTLPPITVPEPGAWLLIGAAAVVGVVVSRNRRK